MASLFFPALLSLVLFFSLSSATHRHSTTSPPELTKSKSKPPPLKASLTSIPPEIHQACKATRYPDTCQSSLVQSNQVPPNPNPTQIIQSAMWVSSQNLKTAQSMVQTILDSSSGNLNRSTAAKHCLEVLHNSEYRIQSTVDALPRGKIKDARAWMSAALLYQYDCWSTLKYVNDSQQVNDTMAYFDSLIGLTSNALSMIMSYDNFGNETGSWRPPMTERDGFWEGAAGPGDGSGMGYKGGLPLDLTADLTVCKGGSGGGKERCDYGTVQQAVDKAPDNLTERRFVIRIKEGLYEETVRVPLEKKNLVFLGDGMGKTVITGSLNVGQPGISAYNTATVGVVGDGFMASGLTIQNTAGPDAHQAVAFRSGSDLSVIENCEFIGNQDTLYAHALRQFYKSCHIQGNVDFIFGNSASIFQDCLILVWPRQVNPEKGENNAVTAHGRTDPAQSTGFVFQNCLVNGTDDYMALYYKNPKVHKNFLGRPWKEYSRTVFIQCDLEALITPQGWMPWSGDFALKTLYCGCCAKFLVDDGRVDGERLCITGCSAGGYTTLASLAFRETFKAGASLFGIGDLNSLKAEMHKFESHYISNLVGNEEALFERSPINFVDKFSCPIILFQGLEDKVVDPKQARKIYMALKKKGLPVALVEYEGEPHGFRKADNIKFTLEQQMVFFARTVGRFTVADEIIPIQIDNFD